MSIEMMTYRTRALRPQDQFAFSGFGVKDRVSQLVGEDKQDVSGRSCRGDDCVTCSEVRDFHLSSPIYLAIKL
jgi:hypothetical protein